MPSGTQQWVHKLRVLGKEKTLSPTLARSAILAAKELERYRAQHPLFGREFTTSSLPESVKAVTEKDFEVLDRLSLANVCEWNSIRQNYCHKPVSSAIFAQQPLPSLKQSLTILSHTNEIDSCFMVIRNLLKGGDVSSAFLVADCVPPRRSFSAYLGLASALTLGAVATSAIVDFVFASSLATGVAGFTWLLMGIPLLWPAKYQFAQWANIVSPLKAVKDSGQLSAVNYILERCEEGDIVGPTVSSWHYQFSTNNATNLEGLAIINKELAARKIKWVLQKADIEYAQYWQRAGQGFEWVEPDQDPAELAALRSSKISPAQDTTTPLR